MRKHHNSRKYSLTSLLIIALCVLAAHNASRGARERYAVSAMADGVSYVQFIDVGQGDSALISLPSGENVLIDAGPKSSAGKLCNYLNEQDVEKIDLLVLTHPHEDHIGGAEKVFDLYDVEELLIPDGTSDSSIYKKTMQSAEDEGCKITTAKAGMTTSFSNAQFTVLGPVFPEEYDTNNLSIVMTYTYGETRFIFTGDAEFPAENDIIDKFGDDMLKSDVLKVGHHGSSTSTGYGFLSAVSPDFAAISCGKNNEYGHPHSEILNMLKTAKVDISRTDTEGTIVFSTDGKTVIKCKN